MNRQLCRTCQGEGIERLANGETDACRPCARVAEADYQHAIARRKSPVVRLVARKERAA